MSHSRWQLPQPDIADLIYGIHRCTHGHGDELPEGFELIPDAAGQPMLTRLHMERNKVQLSDRAIFGLLAVVVMSPANVGQLIPETYFLTLGTKRFLIHEWWGRRQEFAAILAQEPLANVKMDFTDWMTNPTAPPLT